MSSKVDIDNLNMLIGNIDADLDDLAATRATPAPAVAAIVAARAHLARASSLLLVAGEEMTAAPALVGSLQ